MSARYEAMRAVAAGLEELSKGVPFPGNLGLASTSRLVLVMTAFMELREVQQRVRELADRLMQRAVDISNLIARHQRQLRRDNASSSFILRFVDTMEVIHVFVADFGPPKKQGLSRRVWAKVTVGVGAAFGKADVGGQATMQVFETHWRSLDSILVEFQSYLLSSQATMGPHQLIKHPDIQAFWRCRLTNALETRWEYFWDHFLDEYPQLKEVFWEEDKELRHIFQSLTTSRSKDVVDPMGLNKVFQPTDDPVEKIVHAHLQSHLSSNSASKLVEHINPATQGEVQQWRGYYVQASHKGPTEMEIFVTYTHHVLGSGVDEVGEFTIQGEELMANMNWTKHYVAAHIVNYQGTLVGKKRMEGTWSLSVDSHGYWSRGDFVLERVEDNDSHALGLNHHVEAHLQNLPYLNRLRGWTGYYEQFGQQHSMTTDLVFTLSGRIHGKGIDSIGHYTWCGTFQSKNQKRKKEVSLIKQYFQAHAIFYEGHLEEIGSEELVIEGTWTIPDMCDGLFRLDSVY